MLPLGGQRPDPIVEDNECTRAVAALNKAYEVANGSDKQLTRVVTALGIAYLVADEAVFSQVPSHTVIDCRSKIFG